MFTESGPGGNAAQQTLRCLDVETGVELWNQAVDGYGSVPGPIAGVSGRVYAARTFDLLGMPWLAIGEFDVASGQLLRLLPLGSPWKLRGLSVSEFGLAAWTQRDFFTDPATSERAWVFDRVNFDLLDSRDGDFAGAKPLAYADGFAFLSQARDRVDQLGKREDFFADPTPSPEGWSFEAPGTATLDGLAVMDGGSALAWVETDAGGELDLRVVDSRSGAELWQLDAQELGSGQVTQVALADSDLHELQAWSNGSLNQTTTVADPGVGTQWQGIALPDVLVVPGFLSTSLGGTAELHLRGQTPGNSFNNAIYVALGGLQVVGNGLQTGGVTLPFAAGDPFLSATLTPQPGTFDQFIGLLDPNGNATARVTLPPGTDPALAGQSFWFGFLDLVQSQAPPSPGIYVPVASSDASPLTLVP
ncbi:MAG: hypothetical protein ACYS26_03870 [Planctomycetota bacterium]|jgi:hypothetical protein